MVAADGRKILIINSVYQAVQKTFSAILQRKSLISQLSLIGPRRFFLNLLAFIYMTILTKTACFYFDTKKSY